MRRSIILAAVLLAAVPVCSAQAVCRSGGVFEDIDRDGVRDAGERGLADVQVSDGRQLVRTDARGDFQFTQSPGSPVFVIKPATHSAPRHADGRLAMWRGEGTSDCVFALHPAPQTDGALDVLVLADPQTASEIDVDYYARDIIDSVLAERATPAADLGLTLGDVVARGRTDLYPLLDRETVRLGAPWLHVPGNHDMDAAAQDDASSLHAFERHYGPATYAWEAPQATFVLLDDVIRIPAQSTPYVGGIREEQFEFLERYLEHVDRDRLLVLAVHIPLFDTAPGRETFRRADRERLFRLLERFPKRLVLSGHGHVQRHVFHDAASGWNGETPLHEYNVGAASGAFWSGVKDAAGIPNATMSDGTPNGYARLRIEPDGEYRLSWHPARLSGDDPGSTAAMGLHAPRVLRRGAYQAWGVYANVYMGHDGTRVAYRVDGGEWKPMTRVNAPDPRLLAENVADDDAGTLRGYDRSPEATPSPHLWRGALPTDLAVGEHRVEVRAFDAWTGEQRASTRYRLEEAAP
jgi:hypothetical protein